MANIMVRKCAKCKGEIEIDMNDIHDIVLRNRLYYHRSCLIELAIEKVQAKKGKWQVWQEVLDNIEQFEDMAKETLKQYLARDDLNNYLISVYDITVVPERFFQVVADLNNGIYKKKRCNPVKTSDILGTWKWGQKKLDSINRCNIQNHQGPKNDSDRILYDLAIVVRHLDDFKKYQSKIKAMDAERKIAEKENIKINYNKIKTVSSSNDGLDDISDLLDELI